MPGFPSPPKRLQNGSLIATALEKGPPFCNICPGIYIGASSVKRISSLIKMAGLRSCIRKAKPAKRVTAPSTAKTFCSSSCSIFSLKDLEGSGTLGFFTATPKNCWNWYNWFYTSDSTPQPAAQDLLLSARAAIPQWWFWDLVAWRGTPDKNFETAIAAAHSKQEEADFMENLAFLKPVSRFTPSYTLRRSDIPATSPLPPTWKKISSYNLTGLVQLPDKIVVRFAHTIYPCSLGCGMHVHNLGPHLYDSITNLLGDLNVT